MRTLKRLLIGAYVWAAGRVHRLAGPDIALSLGHVLKKPGKFVRGGRVKLTHLRERFGDRLWRFNLLYVVSSGLPSNPDLWIRVLRKAGVKIVWNQNGVAYPAWISDRGRMKRINTPMQLLREADFVVYQSTFCKESADRWLVQTPSPHAIVPNAVDTDLFAPSTEILSSSPLRLLVMGSHMTPEKVMVPLQTVRLLKDLGLDVRLSIVGPHEWPDAHQQVQEALARWKLADSVTLHGKFLQHEAPELYRQHHLFVHLKYMDPCPTAVIEAMSCGLPVIGSASGGMPELVSSDAGILLDVPHDWDRMHYPTAEAVADAARRIVADLPRYRDGARSNAVTRFDMKQWLDTHERIFRTLIGI